MFDAFLTLSIACLSSGKALRTMAVFSHLLSLTLSTESAIDGSQQTRQPQQVRVRISELHPGVPIFVTPEAIGRHEICLSRRYVYDLDHSYVLIASKDERDIGSQLDVCHHYPLIDVWSAWPVEVHSPWLRTISMAC